MNLELSDLLIAPILQETCITCGPASVRMVVGRNSAQEGEILRELLKFVECNPNNCFVTSPEGMVHLLRQAGRSFRVERRKSIEEVNRLVVNTILDFGIPVPVLIKSCLHWVVCRGLIYLEQGGVVGASSYIINDPYNPCLDCDQDGRIDPYCESGIPKDDAIDFVPAAQWRLKVLTECRCGGNSPEYICVVPENATDGPRAVVELLDQAAVPPVEGPIDVGDLNACLKWARRVYGFKRHPRFRVALEGATVVRAQEVFGDEYGSYFLAEVGKPGAISAVFLFDRSSGSVISARAFDRAYPRFLPSSLGEMRDVVRAWRTRSNMATNVEESLRDSSPLVWAPYREFRSPYFPFYSLGEGEDRVYVGINGVVYKHLEPAKA